MSILITGGAGYIGSHTVIALINSGYDVIVLDNFSNSSPESLKRVSAICKKDIKSYKVDLKDLHGVENVFKNEKIDAVIHFSALKAVGESVSAPLEYYENNVSATISLLKIMKKYNVKNMVFSSSATVYGEKCIPPFTEDNDISAINPYGQTKVMTEHILMDLCKSDPSWNIISLRYANPIGAHSSGLIGENPNGIPNNILPYISQVAVGKLQELKVFGNDYDTPDGTGVRDYIHVCDLAKGHVLAIKKLEENPPYEAYNLGTGNGVSVLELIKTFEEASGKQIPYKITERRAGDSAVSYLDVKKAEKHLGFKAEKTLFDMCKDSWHFQSENPNGY